MRAGKARSRRERSGKWAIKGMGISLLVSLLMAMGTAALISGGTVSETWMDELAALILLLSSFLGSAAACRGEERIKEALMAGIGYWSALVILQMVVFSVSVKGVGATGIAVFGGVGASMLLKPPGRRRYAGGKKAYR